MRDTTQPAVTPNPPNERRECSETDSGSILSGTQPPTSAGGEVQSKGARSVRRPSSMVWLVPFLTLPAVLLLLAPGYFYKAHDGTACSTSSSSIRPSVSAWWPVWGPDHAIGFGYPLWLIYAPLAYFIGEAFHLLTASPPSRRPGRSVFSWAAWACTGWHGAGGGESAGLIASIAFTYAPYHPRTDLLRALRWPSSWPWPSPWTLLVVNAERPGPAWAPHFLAALGVAALLISHTVSVLSFVPLLAGFMLVLLVRSLLAWRGQPGRAVLAGLQAPWAGTPAASRPGEHLPAALGVGAPLHQRSAVVGAHYSYEQHFVYPPVPRSWLGFRLFRAEAGRRHELSTGAAVIVAAAVGVQLDARFGQSRRRGEAVFLVLATAIALFVMTPAAAFIWDNLSIIKMVQFPWRLLADRVQCWRCWPARACTGWSSGRRSPRGASALCSWAGGPPRLSPACPTPCRSSSRFARKDEQRLPRCSSSSWTIPTCAG